MDKSESVPPNWVEDLFAEAVFSSEASPAFLTRCREAALSASAVAHLRAPVRNAAFQPLAFGFFVQQMAYAAGVSLQRVFYFLRLVGKVEKQGEVELERPTSAAVRLGFEMGIPDRLLLLYLKLGCLARAGVPEVQFGRLRGGDSRREAFLQRVELAVEEWVKEMDPAVGREFQRLEDLVGEVRKGRQVMDRGESRGP